MIDELCGVGRLQTAAAAAAAVRKLPRRRFETGTRRVFRGEMARDTFQRRAPARRRPFDLPAATSARSGRVFVFKSVTISRTVSLRLGNRKAFQIFFFFFQNISSFRIFSIVHQMDA